MLLELLFSFEIFETYDKKKFNLKEKRDKAEKIFFVPLRDHGGI